MPRWTLVSPAVVLAAVAVPFNAIIGMNVAKEHGGISAEHQDRRRGPGTARAKPLCCWVTASS